MTGARWIAAIVLGWVWLAIPGFAEESVAGSVKTAQGASTVRRGAETIAIHEGLHLLENDVLETGGDGRLGIVLQDGTRISLGPNTELKIDSFVYQPVNARFALLLRMARGVMVYVSGKIAQFSPGSVRVETPVGVLGLRGTEFAVALDGVQ
jgi:hypothetical protein